MRRRDSCDLGMGLEKREFVQKIAVHWPTEDEGGDDQNQHYCHAWRVRTYPRLHHHSRAYHQQSEVLARSL